MQNKINRYLCKWRYFNKLISFRYEWGHSGKVICHKIIKSNNKTTKTNKQ